MVDHVLERQSGEGDAIGVDDRGQQRLRIVFVYNDRMAGLPVAGPQAR